MKIPTAEEFIQQEQFYAVTSGDEYEISQAMIEFAKLHVQDALKCASKKSKRKEGQICDSKLTNSILNSYNYDNIK